MLVVNGQGMPFGFHLDSAQHAEVRLADSSAYRGFFTFVVMLVCINRLVR